MPGTPLTSLHHRVYPLMVRFLVVTKMLPKYVVVDKVACVTTLDCSLARNQGHSQLPRRHSA